LGLYGYTVLFVVHFRRKLNLTKTDLIIHDNPLDGLENLIQGFDLLLSIEGPAALDDGLIMLVRLMRAQGLTIREKLNE